MSNFARAGKGPRTGAPAVIDPHLLGNGSYRVSRYGRAGGQDVQDVASNQREGTATITAVTLALVASFAQFEWLLALIRYENDTWTFGVGSLAGQEPSSHRSDTLRIRSGFAPGLSASLQQRGADSLR